MSNVVRLIQRAPRQARPSSDQFAALAGLASTAAKIGGMHFSSKERIQEAIFLFGETNVQARQIIHEIEDDETRARLLAYSDRISELVEIAGRKAAEL